MFENHSGAASRVTRMSSPQYLSPSVDRATLEGLGFGVLAGGLCLLITPWVELALLASAIAGLLGGLRVYGQNNH